MLEPAPLLMAGEIYPPSGGGDILPNYWNPSRADPDIILRSTAAWGTSVTFGVGAWGSWFQIEAGYAEDLVLVQLDMTKTVTVTCSFWLEIGLGAAGSEEAIACVGQDVMITGSGAYPHLAWSRRLAPRLVPAGTRVAARGWTTAGYTDGVVNLSCIRPAPAALWCDPWPNSYIGGGRVIRTHRVPAVGGWLSVAGGGVSWTEVVAAAPNDMLFVAAQYDATNAGGGSLGNRVEVGVGASGQEVVFSRVAIPSGMSGTWPYGEHQVGRKSLILSGERVAARLMGSAAGPWRMAFYFEDL